MAEADEQNQLRLKREAEAKTKAEAEAAAKAAARQKRMDEIAAERDARMKAEAEARAKSNPMFDPTNRPAAPPADDKFVYYYGWIGGAGTGQWRLYKQAKTNESAAAVAATRSTAGQTQATFSTAVGANTVTKPTTVTTTPSTTTPSTTTPSTTTPSTTTPSTTTPSTTTPSTTTPSTTTPSTTTPSTTTPSTTVVTPTPTVVDTQILGSGANRFIRTYYSNGTFVDTPSPETVSGGAAGLDPATTALITSYQKQNADLLAQFTAQQQQAQADAKAAAEAVAKENRENAISVLTDRFTRYGLASLVPRIKQLAISGASESTITLQLQESEEYKTRFKANQDRIKKGLRVLDPSDYLNLEDDYRQILRAYGLKAFDTDAYVQQFIANDIATTELSNRVVTAVQRVQNADPAVLTTLRSFYGISDNDLVAYVLDPNQQFQKIERQVAAAEIGAAAGLQGISTGVPVAEQLAAQGVTKAQAQKGYATIADILPTAEKLSGIYDKTLPSYGLAEAEQEVFNTLASAQRKRRALAEREIAEFSGASGLSKSALSKQIGGTY